MTTYSDREKEFLALGEKIRKACMEAAREGLTEASQDGLCSEGALEVALGAIQRLDLESVIKSADQG